MNEVDTYSTDINAVNSIAKEIEICTEDLNESLTRIGGDIEDYLNTTIGEVDIQKIENDLVNSKIGITAWTATPFGFNKDGNSGYLLGFFKLGKNRNKKWKLVARQVTISDNNVVDNAVDTTKILPLTTLPRHFRIMAIDLIPELMAQIINNSKEYLAHIKESNLKICDIRSEFQQATAFQNEGEIANGN